MGWWAPGLARRGGEPASWRPDPVQTSHAEGSASLPSTKITFRPDFFFWSVRRYNTLFFGPPCDALVPVNWQAEAAAVAAAAAAAARGGGDGGAADAAAAAVAEGGVVAGIGLRSSHHRLI